MNRQTEAEMCSGRPAPGPPGIPAQSGLVAHEISRPGKSVVAEGRV